MDHKAGKFAFNVSSTAVTGGFVGRVDYHRGEANATKVSNLVFQRVCLTNVDAEMHAKQQFELRVTQGFAG